MDAFFTRHFSLRNPQGERQDDFPLLLRRLAEEIERHGEIDILDVTFQREVTANGDWPSMTVYYSTSDDDERGLPRRE